ncbi:D-sedoheptulose 7-phosphate isomerase [Mycolicibacterium sp. BK556]|uniref:D-sedoheptulose 7-phosphate isomerase n=1 Tax=Mycobacteriaceae TaxID=1762 RepID=UPI00105EC6C7|nr:MULTISPECIES: D-sedoheptulose 7-phosphate isomerase [Mycobacteriaceae]MBB3607008.1 D-sedoheptulose 7-phosphate isomerase [Mycolicibacterium sp. BK556]MBB3636779.1 D-sedoheptulose 7-phosphate isomerase [Mycolicibacterium sp. BK607]MBB3747580.1 D-sedoheptulose 7-phosphate isomerase [Mycolicibacterium sp. BK634]TDO08282.1 D-sedoheptulose 7-phosphate isomerase [Mycobacterium sp. BK086]
MRTLEEIFTETIAVKTRVLNDPALLETVRAVGDRLIEGYRAGSRVFMCGNGGSAADAQHFAAELTGHFIFDRPPLGAEALHGNSSHLTAVANDYDYDTVFARALEASARPGDTLVAISTSGNSPNVLRAATVARDIGVTVVAMTGETGGKLAEFADFLINVPSRDTGRIQESHIVFIHAISEHVEYAMFARQE